MYFEWVQERRPEMSPRSCLWCEENHGVNPECVLQSRPSLALRIRAEWGVRAFSLQHSISRFILRQTSLPPAFLSGNRGRARRDNTVNPFLIIIVIIFPPLRSAPPHPPIWLCVCRQPAQGDSDWCWWRHTVQCICWRRQAAVALNGCCLSGGPALKSPVFILCLLRYI